MAKHKKQSNKGGAKVQDQGVDILESPEALQERLDQTQSFANKNKNLLSGIGVVLVLLVAGVFLYQLYMDKQEQEAQIQLFPAVFYFEKDSLDKALNGDGNFTEGLLAVADDYSGTKAGNLAAFYAGASFLKKGEYEKAIEYLKSFSRNDLLVQARAYALIGDAHFEKGETANAISFYKKAVDHKPNKQFTPQYLLKLALAEEAAGNKDNAAKAYKQIIEKYDGSAEINDAKKYLARLGK